MLTEEDKQEIKNIIAEELNWLIKIDRLVIPKNIQILDKRNIQLGRTTGTLIGTDTDQKLGFYGKTPVDQPATVSNSAGDDATAVNAIIARLKELGLIA
jgi:hypothetical protein